MKPQSASGGGGATVGAGSSAKKEKVIPQATAEQLRIAEITNVTTDQDSAELHKKIKNIVEFTGRSQDEAAMALHDCDGDVEAAINYLLETTPKGSGWETSGAKKKKEKQVDRRDESRRPREGREGGGRGRGRGQRGGTYDGAGGGRGRPRGPGRGPPGGPREGRSGTGKGTRLNDADPTQPGWSGNNGGTNENNNNSAVNNGENGGDWDGSTWSDPANPGGGKPGQASPGGTNANPPLSTGTGQATGEEMAAGLQNDTIGNMGNWDDFKADEKNANEWSGPRKDRSSGGGQGEWSDPAGERNSDWKTRQRQQGGNGQKYSTSQSGTTQMNKSSVGGQADQTGLVHADGKVVQSHQQKAGGAQQRVPLRPMAGQAGSGRTKVRLPPASKIPQTPVEMPPDHHDVHDNTIDVQFGALSFGSNSYDPISTLPQSQQQPSKLDQHNGSTGISPAAANLLASTAQTQQSTQQSQSATGHNVAGHQATQGQQQSNSLKATGQSSAAVDNQTSSGLKPLSSGGQVQGGQGSMTVPPGLDKTAVSSVNQAQTHKTASMNSSAQQTTQQTASGVTSQYHNSHGQATPAAAPSNQPASNTNSYQQYSTSNAYKQQTPNTGMAYLQSLSTGIYNPGHSSAAYGQQAAQYGSPNYATSFTGSTVAGGGYKGGKDTGGSASVGAVTDAVNSTATSAASQYDNKKSAASQLQQNAANAAGQAMTPGSLVLQTSQLHGPHMHGYHMAGHPGTMQPLYQYYPHPGQLPPPTGSGAHLATADYSQRDNSTSSANAGTMSASSLLQQHSYDKFVRSQDESGSAAASQGSTTAGSQSTITATAAYPHLGPYNIYYGGPVVPAPFPHMPFMSTQGTGYPATGTASTPSQASKNNTAYGNSQSAFDYPMGNHMSGPAGDYKYQSNKMISNTNKYMSATASERR